MTEACAEATTAARLADRVQALLLSAVAEVCPDHHALWTEPRGAVRTSDAVASGGDLICRAPTTLWNQLLADQCKCGSDSPVGCTVCLRTISEYGLTRDRVYESPQALGEALVAQLPESARQSIADVRVRPDGTLVITTCVHMCRQRALGREHCTACGLFFRGVRGLRNHWHGKHGQAYEEAKASAEAACTALVPARLLDAEEARLVEACTARAAAAARRSAELPAALAAARDGDIAALCRQLDGGWDPTQGADRHGSTALIWAAGGGQLAACKLLHSRGASVTQAQPPSADGRFGGRTALHWSARHGHVDVCRWLVAQGADPNAQTSDGSPPLHWAVWQARLEVCCWLVRVSSER